MKRSRSGRGAFTSLPPQCIEGNGDPVRIDDRYPFSTMGDLRKFFRDMDILDIMTSQEEAKRFKCGPVDRLVKCYHPADRPDDNRPYLFCVADTGYYYDSIPVHPLRNRADETVLEVQPLRSADYIQGESYVGFARR